MASRRRSVALQEQYAELANELRASNELASSAGAPLPSADQKLVLYERRPKGPVAPPPEALAPLEQFVPLVDKAQRFLDASHARQTRAKYDVEWKAFEAWCAKTEVDALPAHPATVALYATHIATTPQRDRWGHVRDARGRKPSGIGIAMAAIAYMHNQQGKASPHQHPDVQRILKGIAHQRAEQLEADFSKTPGMTGGPCKEACAHTACLQTKACAKAMCCYCNKSIGYNAYYYVFYGETVVHAACHDKLPAPQKTPLLGHDLRLIVDAQANHRNQLIAARNRALFLFHFFGAFRRDELASLTVEQVSAVPQGLTVRLGKSKTNQAGRARVPKVLPYNTTNENLCPVRAYQAWLQASGIKAGYIFLHVDQWGHLYQRLSGHAVGVLTKDAAEQATHLDPKNVSSHGWRAGFATAAVRAGKPFKAIMDQTGHVDVGTLMGYVREAEALEHPAAEGLLDAEIGP